VNKTNGIVQFIQGDFTMQENQEPLTQTYVVSRVVPIDAEKLLSPSQLIGGRVSYQHFVAHAAWEQEMYSGVITNAKLTRWGWIEVQIEPEFVSGMCLMTKWIPLDSVAGWLCYEVIDVLPVVANQQVA